MENAEVRFEKGFSENQISQSFRRFIRLKGRVTTFWGNPSKPLKEFFKYQLDSIESIILQFNKSSFRRRNHNWHSFFLMLPQYQSKHDLAFADLELDPESEIILNPSSHFLTRNRYKYPFSLKSINLRGRVLFYPNDKSILEPNQVIDCLGKMGYRAELRTEPGLIPEVVPAAVYEQSRKCEHEPSSGFLEKLSDQIEVWPSI